MKHLIGFLFLSVLAVSSYASPAKIDWNYKELNWLEYEQGMDELKDKGKYGLIILYASWCPTCKEYSSLFRDPDIVEKLKGYVLMSVNVEEQPDVSALYDFDGQYIPRTIIVDGLGKVVHSLYPLKERHRYYLPSDEKQPLLKLLDVNRDFSNE